MKRRSRLFFSIAQSIDPTRVDADFGPRDDTGSESLRSARRVGGTELRSPEDYLAVFDSTMARFWVLQRRGDAER